jgi:hypothetical protein
VGFWTRRRAAARDRRHIVRFVDYSGVLFALKELPADLAVRGYRLLRALGNRGIAAVEAVGIVGERGDELQDVLVTRYLDFWARRPTASPGRAGVRRGRGGDRRGQGGVQNPCRAGGRRGGPRTRCPAVGDRGGGTWLAEVFEPAIAAVPRELAGKRDAAQLYHELLEHRWYLSEGAGREVSLAEAAVDYVQNVLRRVPDERSLLGGDELS